MCLKLRRNYFNEGVLRILLSNSPGQQRRASINSLNRCPLSSHDVQSALRSTASKFQPNSRQRLATSNDAEPTKPDLQAATQPTTEEPLRKERCVHQECGAQVPVQFAYHVTNVIAHGSHPQWKELHWSQVENRRFNGQVLRQAPAVYFATTVWKADIPTRSIYPLSGREGEYYWCVKVPLAHFNSYEHILWIHRYEKQVKLFLALDDEIKGLREEIVERLKKKGNLYLRRELTTFKNYNYFCNDYADVSTNYFVNFAVCHNFTLGDGIQWVKMRRSQLSCGYRKVDNKSYKWENNEEKRKSLFKSFQNRINYRL